jgi:hypothetical protein
MTENARTHTSSIQSQRGRAGGSISKGGGRKAQQDSQESTKPWVGMGISRRAFFYLKKRDLELVMYFN